LGELNIGLKQDCIGASLKSKVLAMGLAFLLFALTADVSNIACQENLTNVGQEILTKTLLSAKEAECFKGATFE